MTKPYTDKKWMTCLKCDDRMFTTPEYRLCDECKEDEVFDGIATVKDRPQAKAINQRTGGGREGV